ncbi:MAG TPA: arsenate reductase (glutaredoxin) [Actinomycetota bacterium]|nr:arsenate reductase (glutaredoxin) [Actinomycetota bacterium]
MASTHVLFNPSCSKCRSLRGLLEDQGIDHELVRYLDAAPTVAELKDIMRLLGITDPRDMMRTNEKIYSELDLATADHDRLLEAMTKHPILIQRPIVIRGDRAVIARPPERALALFSEEREHHGDGRSQSAEREEAHRLG